MLDKSLFINTSRTAQDNIIDLIDYYEGMVDGYCLVREIATALPDIHPTNPDEEFPPLEDYWNLLIATVRAMEPDQLNALAHKLIARLVERNYSSRPYPDYTPY
jgi:hypothetical protein